MLRPLRDYLLVEPIERVVSNSLAVVHHEKPSVGRVAAVGPGVVFNGKIRPLDVTVGSLVRFGTDAGYLAYPEYLDGGRRFLVLREADICFIAESSV